MKTRERARQTYISDVYKMYGATHAFILSWAQDRGFGEERMFIHQSMRGQLDSKRSSFGSVVPKASRIDVEMFQISPVPIPRESETKPHIEGRGFGRPVSQSQSASMARVATTFGRSA